jgi:type III secretion protein U
MLTSETSGTRMAQNDDSGDKTEQPTPKKLQDARKKGQVAKSRDVTSTVTLFAALALALLAVGYAGSQFLALVELSVGVMHEPFANAAPRLARAALMTLLGLSAAVLVPMAVLGVLTEYLQAGPVFSLDRVSPNLEHMNPVEGVKRMFSMDTLVELAKAVVKAAALLFIGWLAVRAMLPELALLPLVRDAAALGDALAVGSRHVLVWTLVLFVLLALMDASYQRYSFLKKMRMSHRDIRQEMKDSEGDPHVKQQRRQVHQEWSQRHAAAAARDANVLVVNPTHVAVAIDYDRETCPVPAIAAVGQDEVARAMREAAEEGGVPVVRNVPLARDLLARGEVGELVPPDLFDVIADVVLWAREVRDELAHGAAPPEARRRPPPGLDLTRYPDRRTHGPAEDEDGDAAAALRANAGGERH